MNPQQPYMDVNQQHAPPPGPTASLAPYSTYGQPQALQPASHAYTSNYPPYSYAATMAPMAPGHHVTSSMGGPMGVPQSLPLPTMASQPQAPQQASGGQPFDTTGQIAPPGMKPRVTATLWEDEGSLCFQVEANGVCVARREDNHMINGTKLLNVAGMTRGRRDGILKSEKTRHVVKIGPMHLKGVWIPFDRALDFANKEKITEMLYPLFVHNIGALLYHPTNQARQSIGNAAMAARRPDQQPQGNAPPALTHHHTVSNPIGASLPPPSPSTVSPYGTGRPGLERAYTFPTPPPSASSLTVGMGTAGSSYDYGGQGPPMHAASTPPGAPQGTVPYHQSQPYDSSRQMYSATSNFSGYPSQHMQRYGGMHSSPGGPIKSEMGPPARAGPDHEHPDTKPHDGYGPPPDAEAEHESDYTHNRPMPQDSSHVSPEMTHSPHQNGSGRATPRTTNPYQPYGTPQRAAQLPSSNLAYVMSTDARAAAPNGPEAYHSAGYPPQPYPSMNGAPPLPSNKRMREVDDEDAYGRPLGGEADGIKRQRTDGGPVGGRPISQPHSVKAGGMRR